MTARRRIVALVGLAAIVAVGLVALAIASAGGDEQVAGDLAERREGQPPLTFALGFREDAEAQDLSRGAALYADGKLDEAAALFAKHDSLEAKVGAAFASWPEGTYDRLEQLAKLFPEAPVIRLHLGLVRLWANRGDPIAAWRAVVDDSPDTPYAILAGNLLHPRLPRGLPAFIPSFSAPVELRELPRDRQLDALEERAASGEVRDLLLYGVGLQRVGRPVSAAEVFERAAKAAPDDVEAQVAAAVGAFDKATPEDAFGRLGPLTNRFPKEPTVRFHLGVLLLWTGRVDEAERQFRQASKSKPGSPLAKEAERYLETIREARS